MFSPGQTVYHRTRKHSGKVQECDGNTVYLVQDNGVEIEFPASDLTATPPAGKTALAAASPIPTRVLTINDITPEHRRVLSVIPPRTLQSVASLHDRNKRIVRFNTLDPAQKLNYIADVTAVPYRIMKEFSDRPGELGLMMAKGLAISAGSPL
jgi:hypothetical protein